MEGVEGGGKMMSAAVGVKREGEGENGEGVGA